MSAALDPEAQGYTLPYHWIPEPDSIWRAIRDTCALRAVRHVVDSGARRVLELGCGDGWNCGQLVAAGLQVVGVDWSRLGIEHARRLVPGATFLCGDITDAALATGAPFDAVLLMEVIEHIPPADCPGVLRSIRARLRPGGALVLTTPSDRFPLEDPRHFRHFSVGSLRALLEGAGFDLAHVEGYGRMRDVRWFRRLLPVHDNRLFRIKPIHRRAIELVRARAADTPQQDAVGFVCVARLSAGP